MQIEYKPRPDHVDEKVRRRPFVFRHGANGDYVRLTRDQANRMLRELIEAIAADNMARGERTSLAVSQIPAGDGLIAVDLDFTRAANDRSGSNDGT